MQTCPATHTYQLVDVTVSPPAIIEQYDRCEGVVQGVLPGAGFVWFVQPAPAPTLVTFDCAKFGPSFGGISWGVKQWACEGLWLGLKTPSLYFASSVGVSRSFNFEVPRVLVGFNTVAYQAGTLTLASDSGETFTQDLVAGQVASIITGWKKPATTVTVTYSKGWSLSVGDLQYQ